MYQKMASVYVKIWVLSFWRNLFSEVGMPRLVQVCNSYLQVQTCVYDGTWATALPQTGRGQWGVDMPSGQRRKQPHCQLSGTV